MRYRLAVWLLLPLALSVLAPAIAYADTKTYFKVFSGDVFSGGWFDSGANSCSTSDPNYKAASISNRYPGGILTFSTSSRQGASTSLAAFAMGLIEGQSSPQYGFFTASSGNNLLTFSNTNSDSGSWGGVFAGETPQMHCIPDYYTTKQNNPSNLGTATAVDLSTLTSRQYIVTPVGASVNLAAASTTIAANKQITLFVNGNAYIGSDIKYATDYNADNIPKLTIVAKGNIYIGPSVSQIDGLYIAQPTTGTQNGNIWTCHDATTTNPDGNWIAGNCGSKLTINGAMIAKQAVFVRTKGDLASAPANENSDSANIAEAINYIPSMVLGGPFFNPPASQNLTIDSIISLPPVF